VNEKVEFKGVLIRDVQDAIDAYRAARGRAEVAEAKLREAVEVTRDLRREVSSLTPRDDTPAMRRAAAFLATMEKPRD
jgi:hypothetical protein